MTVNRCIGCHKEWITAGAFVIYEGTDRPPTAEAQGDRQVRSTMAGIWDRIASCAGQEFATKTGKPFAYDCDGRTVHLRNTNRSLPRAHFEAALQRFPVSGPGELQDLQGPSYIWAILNDPRIASD